VCRRPGGVGDQHVGAARLRGLQRVVDHGGRVGARGLRNDRHAVAVAPDLQLLDGGGAEGVARGEHHLAALGRQAAGELADGGGLARAVHADHQDHVRAPRLVDLERSAHRADDVEQRLAQRVEQCVEVAEFLARHLAAQVVEDLLRGLDADVGTDQARLEFVEDGIVDLAARQQVGEVVGEPGIAAIELGAQPREEARLLVGRLLRLRGRGLVGLLRPESEESH